MSFCSFNSILLLLVQCNWSYQTTVYQSPFFMFSWTTFFTIAYLDPLSLAAFTPAMPHSIPPQKGSFQAKNWIHFYTAEAHVPVSFKDSQYNLLHCDPQIVSPLAIMRDIYFPFYENCQFGQCYWLDLQSCCHAVVQDICDVLNL